MYYLRFKLLIMKLLLAASALLIFSCNDKHAQSIERPLETWFTYHENGVAPTAGEQDSVGNYVTAENILPILKHSISISKAIGQTGLIPKQQEEVDRQQAVIDSYGKSQRIMLLVAKHKIQAARDAYTDKFPNTKP